MRATIRLFLAMTAALIAMVLTAAPSAWTAEKPRILQCYEVKKEMDTRSTGRQRLTVTLAPDEDQSWATRDTLLDTVVAYAMYYQRETNLPVITINIICQEAENSWGESQLVIATYIPDKKGYDGRGKQGPWDMVMAADRGFTDQELAYLELWASLRAKYTKGGTLDEDALDAAVCKELQVKPGSIVPFANFMRPE